MMARRNMEQRSRVADASLAVAATGRNLQRGYKLIEH